MPPAKKRARVESERKSVQAGKKLPRTIRKQTLHTHDDASALDAAKRDIAEGAPPKAAASYFVHEEMWVPVPVHGQNRTGTVDSLNMRAPTPIN